MKRILLFFGLLFLANILIGQTTAKDTVNVKPFEDLTLVTDGTVDTSDQFLMYDISAGLFSYRLSLGELLKKAIDVPNIVGSSQILNGSILDTDISGSAGIGLNKLATTAAGRLLLTDSGGAGTWVSGTPGYGLTISGISMLADTSSASGLVSKSRLTNALDDVSATGGIWEQENTNTLASANTTDNYHQGNIGVGDFSATTIGAGLHILGGTNSSIRLSDTATTDSATLAYIDFYRGASTSQIGRFGFTNTGDADMYLRNVIASGGIVMQTNGLSKAKLFPTGQLQLLDYGSGTFSGTAAYNLQVDASGNIIETAAGGGGSSQWTTTGSDIYYSTGNIAVGTTTPNNAEILAKTTSGGSQIQVESTGAPAILTTTRTDGHWMSLFSTATGFGSGIFLKDSTEFTIAHANAVDSEDSKSFSTADDILYIDSSGNVTTYKTFTPLGGLSGGPSVEADTFKISVDAGSNINVFFEDGDVTHPFTTYAPTNTSARITSSSSGKGGMNFLGFIEDEAGNDPAVKFTAYSEEDLTTGPAIFFSAYKSDGATGRSDPSGSEILAAFGAGTNLKVEVLANGGVRVNAGPMWLSGSGTPEGSVTAPVGSFYSRTDGGAGTSFYVKESGTGNTGWVAK